jgi:septal ring factor EnvC (AmiA/AmiB activator)
MRSKIIFNILIATLTAAILIVGCSNQSSRTGWQVDPSTNHGSITSSGQPTAAESAVELSDKYAKLSEEAVTLRQLNKSLTEQNKKVNDDLESCTSRLNETRNDLERANNLITDTRLELNSWKENVLGFRNEMRDAQKAELEALLKILKMLGAEPAAHTTQPEEQK